jgi:hypothetical protein
VLAHLHLEGEISMITQSFKSWLKTLFAWWPWQQSARVDHVQSVSDGKRSSMYSLSSSVAEGSFIDLHDAYDLQSRPECDDEQGDALVQRTSTCVFDEALVLQEASTMEQRLEFLRYLVKHGIVNEGFARDQRPEQYGHDLS